jgi:hypothetical protein
MIEIHEKVYGAYQSSIKMRWMAMNHGFYG